MEGVLACCQGNHVSRGLPVPRMPWEGMSSLHLEVMSQPASEVLFAIQGQAGN